MSFQSNWNTGFVTEVLISNFSGQTIDGWEVTFSFANGQQVTNSWNTDLAQSGASVSAIHKDYNRTIADGEQVDFGFQGEHGGVNDMPTDVTLIAEGCVTSADNTTDTGGSDEGPDPGGDTGGGELSCADQPPAARMLRLLTRQLEILKVREKINTQVQEEMGRNQREYVLRQQLKAING